MKKIREFITNHSLLIVIVSILLIIPALIGYSKTRINYDILIYLPEDIETIKGENILTDEFKLGAYAFVMVDNMSNYDILKLEDDIKDIDGVNAAVSLADILDTSIPYEILPDEVKDKLYKDNETIIMVTFNGGTSEDSTIAATNKLREVVGDSTKISSMTSMVLDTMNLSNQEMITYVLIAVIFCLIVLLVATDSYVVPFFLLLNIGIAILYNLGSNIFLGQISYITKAITAILQLGVTTDFSIFLYHKYELYKSQDNDKKIAMNRAIKDTFKSVIGSSLTTVAGFLALCSMDLTLGRDIGIVMAKGVICGLICVLTLFPSLLLAFDKLIEKTKHKSIFPKFKCIQKFSIKHHILILIIFVILMIPAYIGNSNYKVYYKLDESLPSDLAFNIANTELAEKFNIVSPEIILIDKNIKSNDINRLSNELKNIEGIDLVLTPSSILDFGLPEFMIPDSLISIMNNDKYQLIILNSTYEIASDELNEQVGIIKDLVNKYDKNGIVAGEGPLMKDLVEIADHDFKMVNYTSIIVIFIIMLFVLKSIGLPVILIFSIEFAIFINMAVAYYTGVELPFIASIVVGTIQLGATIDYAILMSTKYLEERDHEKNKYKAIENTLSVTVPSIIVSSLCFFAATIGVAVYTKIDMIGAICELLSRGSIISMLVVVLILPSLLLVFDKIIMKTTMIGGKNKMKKSLKLLIVAILIIPSSALALTKKETVYSNLDYYGKVNNTMVTNHIYNNETTVIEDETELTNILNINGKEKFELKENKLIWNAIGNDIFYRGSTTKVLPIETKITYYLDDKKIDIKDMIGKSGRVKIVLNFKNNISNLTKINNKFETLYTPFVVTVGTILDLNSKNINVTNGKVINTGTRNMVVGLSSPGLYESMHIESLKGLDEITISYDTTKFNLNNIYIVSTPKLLEESDLEIFNKMDSLTESISSLKVNMDLIESSVKELESGVSTISSGAGSITTNLKNVLDSLELIENGSISLNDGLNEAIDRLKNSTNGLNFTDSLTNLNMLKEGNISAINNLEQANSEIEQIYTKYNLSNIDIKDISEQSLLTVKKTYEGNLVLITLLNKNNEAIDNTISVLTKLPTLINSLSSGLEELKNGSNMISSNLTKLRLGVDELYNGMQNLNTGILKINDGTKKLSSGISEFSNKGINTLYNYSLNIISYSNKAEALINLSNNYKGYTSQISDSTLFISMVKSAR